MQRDQFRRALRIVTLPLAMGTMVACSDHTAGDDPGRAAASSDAAVAGQQQKSLAPPPLASIADESLRADVEALQKAQGTEATIDAIETLQATTDPLSIPFIRPFILAKDPEVAEKAVEAIEFLAIATEDGIPVFSEALVWDVPPQIKRRLMQALYEQRTEIENEASLAKPLLDVLRRDPDPLVRADAVEYAAAVGDAAILPELQAQLGLERDERVRQAIEWSIRLLRNETTEPPPRFDAPS